MQQSAVRTDAAFMPNKSSCDAARFLGLGLVLLGGCAALACGESGGGESEEPSTKNSLGGSGGEEANASGKEDSSLDPSGSRLQISCGVRSLKFAWSAVEGATEYRIEQSEGGGKNFSPLSRLQEGRTFESEVSVHQLDWETTRFRLVACADEECVPGQPVTFEQGAIDCIGFVKPEAPQELGHFGTDVAVSGDGKIMAVSAPGTEEDPGSVTVFRVNGDDEWKETEVLVGPHPGSLFGQSIAMDDRGELLVVGAPEEHSLAVGVDPVAGEVEAPQVGAVYVYRFDGAVFSLANVLKASNAEEGDLFGTSVSVDCDGKMIFVGAEGEQSLSNVINGDEGNAEHNRGLDAGAAYLFTESGASWEQTAYLKPPTPSAGARFGEALHVSCDGQVLAVGARGDSGPGESILPASSAPQGTKRSNSGSVYVFSRNEQSWAQQVLIRQAVPASFADFGAAVSLSGDGSLLAVGAPGSGAAEGVGAYVYEFDGVLWHELDSLPAALEGGLTYPGRSVEVSRDGSLIVVGATWESSAGNGVGPLDASELEPYSGSLYGYKRTDAGFAPAFTAKQKVPGGHDHLGTSIAMSADGGLLAVGADGHSSGATGIGTHDGLDRDLQSSGAVYLF